VISEIWYKWKSVVHKTWYRLKYEVGKIDIHKCVSVCRCVCGCVCECVCGGGV
jgi:hypothetical protein